MPYVLVFALGLCLMQQIDGTHMVFTAFSFIAIIFAGLAFNAVGGLTRPSGTYVFAYAVLALILGLFWKAVLGEAADTYLFEPDTTIAVFAGGMFSIASAAALSRRILGNHKGLIQRIHFSPERLLLASRGCIVIGLVVTTYFVINPYFENGTIISALFQLNQFLQVGLLIGVVAEIRVSGGKRSLNLYTFLGGLLIFLVGLHGYSKQGMFTPPVCWILAACSQRYRVSLMQFFGGILTLVFLGIYLAPYSQIGKAYGGAGDSLMDSIRVNGYMLSHLSEIKEYNQQVSSDFYEKGQGIINNYYATPQGVLDRLQMITPDDSLVHVTENGNIFGISPVIASFANVVPRFLWPGKPPLDYNAAFGHETGYLNAEDYSTGISFSASGVSYHMAKWLGVLLILPALWLMSFTIVDGVFGDIRETPWGLFMCLIFAHNGPEGGIDTVIANSFVGVGELVVIVLLSAYVFPYLGMLVGPKVRVREQEDFDPPVGPYGAPPRRHVEPVVEV